MCMAATSFAQGRDVTAKYLRNADMEQGMKYWSLEGEKVLSKNRKNPATKVGYHGMNQGVLEAWNPSPNMPLSNSTTMQSMHDLPDGTYVFGAYVGASQQNARNWITDEFWSNRDSIYGVSLFANDNEVPVATDNPDWGAHRKWIHSSKFNVATTVTDGILNVGLKVDSTNANYVVWDNATLYYFGAMSEAEALDAMAEIDMTKATNVARELEVVKMNVDTLAGLKAAIADAKESTTTAATLWADNEDLYWHIGSARMSANDYEYLAKSIEAARVVAEGVWPTQINVDILNAVIANAEAAYEVAVMNREELVALRKGLSWGAGDVIYDSVIIAKDALNAFIEEAKLLAGAPGGYSGAQIAMLEDLKVELSDTMVVYEGDAELDFEDRTVNPNSLLPYIARVYETIENVRNNPISVEYTQMPIEFKQAEDGWIEGAEWYSQADRIIAYNSPMYRFEGKIETFRITVKKNKNNAAYFCLSELIFFDVNGNVIPLSEENVTSNADHNALNPGREDGGGIPVLFDGATDDYFHSAWQNMPAEAHYLEVTLPNGGYDAFSFQMLSRSNSSGWDQSHTFPGEMVLSTPAPEREALEVWIGAAKNLNPYSFPEVGYYVKDFSYLTDAIAKAEAILAGNPTEEECRAMNIELRQAVLDFEADEDKAIRLPEAGKAYRIVSAFPAFYEKQGVEKALTAHMADTTLWWGNVSADSLNQVFVFEPILDEGGEPYVKVEFGQNEDGSTWSENYYCYHLKNVGTGLYVDSAFVSNKLKLVEVPTDTLMLYSLGRGQWNILVKGRPLHCGDHNSGNLSTAQGAYGGIYGLGSGICAYGGGLDGASAWYIREYDALPTTIVVEGTEFKSEFIHFESADMITLTANRSCAFENLKLYDIYGNEIAIDHLNVVGNTAKIHQENRLVACAFGFTNNEGVSTVTVDAEVYVNTVALLQEAYDAALAVNPQQGANVMQYADLTVYTAALNKAEAMLAAGAADDKIYAMIEELQSAVASLVPNMPTPGRSYYIISALDGFEANYGIPMMIYDDEEGNARWTFENMHNLNRCWQFEPATEEEGYYLKNVGTGMYLGSQSGMSSNIAMVADKQETVPYTITLLEGDVVAIAANTNPKYRIHANSHAGGSGKAGTLVYWNAGAGTASAWRICDAEAYNLEAFATYTMEALNVESQSLTVVNLPVEMTNTKAVTAFQFDLYLPDGIYVSSTKEDDEVLYNITFNGERAKSSHVIAAEPQGEGILRVVAYSNMNAAFADNDGVIVNIALAVGDVADGNYQIELQNIRMVTEDEQEMLAPDHSATIVIRNLLQGDVNSDGKFSMLDVVMMVNAVLEKAQTNFNAAAADLNGDGKITMVDVVGVLRLVLTDGAATAPSRSAARGAVAMPELNTGDMVTMDNGRIALPVALNNAEAYSAFQLDVVLPAGVKLAEATLTGRAKASHVVAWNTLADGTTRVVAYAMDNASFRGNEGALLNLVLETSDAMSADAMLSITDGLFATVGGAEHGVADVNVMMRSDATYVDGTVAGTFRVYGAEAAVVVECGTDTAVSIYAATGQLVQQTAVKAGKNTITLPAGVYMINGNKVIVK